MAIVESGVTRPKAAHLNKASATRHAFYQIELVREKQQRKYFSLFLPEVSAWI
jgi:hypothetical protein